MAVLVILESEAGQIRQASRSAVAAASKHGEIDVLIAGDEAAAQAAAKLPGVRTVLHAPGKEISEGLAEPLASLIVASATAYDHIVSASTAAGKNIMPRVAALLDVQIIPDVVAVVDSDTFVRPIYAGNALATVCSSDAKKVLTIRSTAFEPVPAEGGSAAIVPMPAAPASDASRIVSVTVAQSERPELDTARIVVSGGRGLKGSEAFHDVLEPLADRLGAAVGASRAAVDEGYAPNDLQVGQTGKIVAPELYLAVGISGAIQHLAGMKDSKIIVAINKDAEAPIFQVADYGLVGDLFEVIPQLTAAL
ncbi:FAD-binding protein [Acetobacter sp. AN02]|uniref:FAD-binding protein n=1 Tax=Acetobacter sp. AN02 TaxID=2894186 RepID=UPI0024341C4F|nr:FAD-binding protein [Acetobacter sp. AN02]MDG6093636.1 FAD-binding protein [Acetobacter sp. AN02]